MNQVAAILTHGDVDGMTCAAQLIRREQGNCQLVFSNAKWIARHLRQLLTAGNLPPRLYVTDIPASESAAAVIEALTEAGTEVYWTDHHPWPVGLVDQVRQCCVHVEYNESLSTPAGVLLGRWLKAEDPYCDQIGRICYASERGTEWERNWYIGKSERDVLDRLAFEGEFTSDDMARIAEQVRLERLAEEILAAEPRTLATCGGKRLAVYDTSERPGIYLGGKVFRHHPVDYCLIRIAEKKWQLASNPSAESDFTALLGQHDLDGFEIRVAGRPERLMSLTAETAGIPPDAHELLIVWLTKAL
jgi:hypothetical protein